ncbi:hypothetical protein [Candidatus Nitrotoga sp. 1052]|nr:hypothetical protein [Candidatus Nitrotoga sp. 1052]CAH1076308.1 hypothetical protein NTG1052_290063 [Candidatus Nitrotoga sp. 1052]
MGYAKFPSSGPALSVFGVKKMGKHYAKIGVGRDLADGRQHAKLHVRLDE